MQTDENVLIKKFDPLVNMSNELLVKAQNQEITNPSELLEATSIKKEITTQERLVGDRKDEVAAPYKDAIKSINEYVKTITDPLENAKKIISEKVLEYNRIQEEKIKAEQERIRLEQEERERKIREAELEAERVRKEQEEKQKELDRKAKELSEEERLQKQKELDLERDKQELEQRRAKDKADEEKRIQDEFNDQETLRLKREEEANKPKGMRSKRSFEIVDVSKIPAEYLQVNETKIREIIKLGVRQIEGVRIFEEKILW